MPRYLYKCYQCKELTVTAHSIKETMVNCEKCGAKDALHKMLTKPTYPSQNKSSQKAPKVGQVTEDFIKEAREDLHRQKTEVLEIESGE